MQDVTLGSTVPNSQSGGSSYRIVDPFNNDVENTPPIVAEVHVATVETAGVTIMVPMLPAVMLGIGMFLLDSWIAPHEDVM